MASLLRSPATLVWALLMLATCASTWWLSKEGTETAIATAAIMVIAAVKVRFVMVHFMELGHAPWRWRLAFEAWIVVFTSIILAMYFSTLTG